MEVEDSEALAALERALAALPLRIGLYIPDDLLEDWFAPGTGMDPVSDEALAKAARLAKKFDCEFKHYPQRKEAVMWKWVPAL